MSIWGSLMKEIDKLVEKAVDDLIMRLVTPTTSPEDAVEAVK